MRLLVCGGRDFTDVNLFYDAMDQWVEQMSLLIRMTGGLEIISGAAKGADHFAAVYASQKGYRLKEFPADWKIHGKRAGFIRNLQMLNEGKPHNVLAFPGGKGTRMMADLAIKANIQVHFASRDPLGKIMMGFKGASSQTTTVEPIIKTEAYQKKYIARVINIGSLSPEMRHVVYQEVLHEEQMWLAKMDEAVQEYEDILNLQDLVDKQVP